MAFSFNTASRAEVWVDKTPSAWVDKLPVYLPTRELLTNYPGFVSQLVKPIDPHPLVLETGRLGGVAWTVA